MVFIQEQIKMTVNTAPGYLPWQSL